ncbi:MAG TPA: cytochrome c oxidase subunit II [Chthoniobacterales bacterium]
MKILLTGTWEFPSASEMAPQMDALFMGLLVISSLVAFAVAGFIVVFGIRYRRGSTADRTPGHGSTMPIEIAWTAVPLAIFVALFVWAAVLYFQMARPPANSVEVHVVAKQWMWKVQHPGGRREINELHVPLGRPVVLVMISQDVIHSFYVPAFRIKQDVLPGRYTRQWFIPNRIGRYHLFCAEYCGTDHSRMIGTVTVMQPPEYARWQETGDVGTSMAAVGRGLFMSRGCSGCHSVRSAISAPLLDGVYGKPVALSDGATVIADEGYIRDSILLPNKQIAAGYSPVMPTFQGQLGEEEVAQLIAYIRSLTAKPETSP